MKALAVLLLVAGCATAPEAKEASHKPWTPAPGQAWQWQLNVPVDTSVDVPVYDIDGFENTAETVAKLHASGRKVICYISAGSAEDFRPDHEDFPKDVQGRPNGWPGERWLDIRRLDVLKPIMASRIEMCRSKGFDAVEPDLVDGYLNKTGFPLTADDQLRYNRMLADLAHAQGLSIALKNDLEQIPQLIPHFDFAINEECAEYGECHHLDPFVKARKAVFHVEYRLPLEDFCGRKGFSSMRKRLELGAWRAPCP